MRHGLPHAPHPQALAAAYEEVSKRPLPPGRLEGWAAKRGAASSWTFMPPPGGGGNSGNRGSSGCSGGNSGSSGGTFRSLKSAVCLLIHEEEEAATEEAASGESLASPLGNESFMFRALPRRRLGKHLGTIVQRFVPATPAHGGRGAASSGGGNAAGSSGGSSSGKAGGGSSGKVAAGSGSSKNVAGGSGSSSGSVSGEAAADGVWVDAFFVTQSAALRACDVRCRSEGLFTLAPRSRLERLGVYVGAPLAAAASKLTDAAVAASTDDALLVVGGLVIDGRRAPDPEFGDAAQLSMVGHVVQPAAQVRLRLTCHDLRGCYQKHGRCCSCAACSSLPPDCCAP